MRKNLSRMLALLFALAVLTGILSVGVFAADGKLTLTVSNPTGRPGETVSVNIDVADNPGISSLKFDVKYDSMLTLTNTEFGSAFQTSGLQTDANPTRGTVNSETVTLISWASDTSINGTLITLTFEISENAPDNYDADITISYNTEEVFNEQEDPIALDIRNGSVTVCHGVPGDINGDGSVNTKDAILLFRYVAGRDVTLVYPGRTAGLTYVSNGNGTCYVSDIGTCTDTTIVIPKKSPSGDRVTAIGDNAFEDYSSLESITIPNSVTSIGYRAFNNCTSLTSITIPDSVTSIGKSAFEGCTCLASITIPDSVTRIGEWAFYGCTSLTSITIPDSVTSIGGSAFSGCTSLTSIAIPDSVTSIGGSAFNGCTSLTSITIGNSVTSIGDYAFYGCTSLTSITIPNSVTSIGYRAFNNCTSLTSITIPDSVTSIGWYAFYGCTNLTSIAIPDSVDNIYNFAFGGCTSLTDVYYQGTSSQWSAISIGEYNTPLTSATIHFDSTLAFTSNGDGTCYVSGAYAPSDKYAKIPSYSPSRDKVTAIGDKVFYNCKEIEYVDIPSMVTKIGDMAFANSTLKMVGIPDSVTDLGGGVFYGCSDLVKVYIGTGVKSLDVNGSCGMFDGCKSLTSVTIPGNVNSIDTYAFWNCSNLKTVIIGNGVTRIGICAFYGCTSLGSITIPDSVTSIGWQAFWGCTSLTSIAIPDSVNNIYNYAFDNCTSLTDVYYQGTSSQWNAISIGENNTPLTSATIHYKSTLAFTSNGDGTCYVSGVYAPSDKYVVIPSYSPSGDKVTAIGDKVFYNCKEIEYVDIPSTVTKIGDMAFANSTLKEIDIPDTVTDLGGGGFYHCTDLEKAKIGTGVKELRYYIEYHGGTYSWIRGVFAYCTSLASITIPDSVTSIDLNAFYNTAYYNNDANWSNDVLYIGNHLIKARDSISGNYVIKDGTKYIASGAFSFSKSLTSVTIPNSVTHIGSTVFYNCTSLAKVYYTGTATQWSEIRVCF